MSGVPVNVSPWTAAMCPDSQATIFSASGHDFVAGGRLSGNSVVRVWFDRARSRRPARHGCMSEVDIGVVPEPCR